MSDLAENLSALRPRPDDVARARPPDHIDGAPVPPMSGAWRDAVSPVKDSVIARVARSTVADADHAARAFDAWRNVPAADRARILHAVVDDIGARRCRLRMTGSRV